MIQYIVHVAEGAAFTAHTLQCQYTLLCPGPHSQVRCYDWDADGSHDLIGEFTTNMAELMEGKKQV